MWLKEKLPKGKKVVRAMLKYNQTLQKFSIILVEPLGQLFGNATLKSAFECF